jgi:hypothetical protein
MQKIWLPPLALLGLTLLCGFDLSRHSVPTEQIISGGPPKDGIPALLSPEFIPAAQASFLDDSDRVLGLVIRGEARAYPLRILDWHELVDDVVGSRAVAVTFCPLTRSGIVYDRRLGAASLTFGVSGMLYQSNLLMYDKSTESLWSQLGGEAIAGPMTGARLEALPSVETTWGEWRREHPDTRVLSTNTGFQREYGKNPYAKYEASSPLMFPVTNLDSRLPPKTPVFGVTTKDDSEAFLVSALSAGQAPVHVRIGNSDVTVRYDRRGDAALVEIDGRPAVATRTYWFAWSAFHPKTVIWRGIAETNAQRRSAADDSPDLESGVYGFSGTTSAFGENQMGVVGECVWIHDGGTKKEVASGYCYGSNPGNFRVPLRPGRYVIRGPGGPQAIEIKQHTWTKVDSLLQTPAGKP